jgi:hypothetical protein
MARDRRRGPTVRRLAPLPTGGADRDALVSTLANVASRFVMRATYPAVISSAHLEQRPRALPSSLGAALHLGHVLGFSGSGVSRAARTAITATRAHRCSEVRRFRRSLSCFRR